MDKPKASRYEPVTGRPATTIINVRLTDQDLADLDSLKRHLEHYALLGSHHGASRYTRSEAIRWLIRQNRILPVPPKKEKRHGLV